jgi:hypothetical protein
VENYSKMEKEKIIEIVENVKDKSNKDLIESRDILLIEFEKTKALIIDLTRHMEAVGKDYEIINTEIGRRVS